MQRSESKLALPPHPRSGPRPIGLQTPLPDLRSATRRCPSTALCPKPRSRPQGQRRVHGAVMSRASSRASPLPRRGRMVEGCGRGSDGHGPRAQLTLFISRATVPKGRMRSSGPQQRRTEFWNWAPVGIVSMNPNGILGQSSTGYNVDDAAVYSSRLKDAGACQTLSGATPERGPGRSVLMAALLKRRINV